MHKVRFPRRNRGDIRGEEMTEGQGEQIIELLEKILETLELLKNPTIIVHDDLEVPK